MKESNQRCQQEYMLAECSVLRIVCLLIDANECSDQQNCQYPAIYPREAAEKPVDRSKCCNGKSSAQGGPKALKREQALNRGAYIKIPNACKPNPGNERC